MVTIEDSKLVIASTALTDASFERLSTSSAPATVKRRRTRRAVCGPGRITIREQEIAALVAEGLTNAQIASRLVLAPGSVANHVEHILRKLELRGRVQIAVWAVKHGLH
jgi:DNA-binding NarL/FixJ family response regulator